MAAHEEIDAATKDVIAAGYHLAQRRAHALGHEPDFDDVIFAFYLLCKWPWKPEADPSAVAAGRWLVVGAAQEKWERLDEAIADETLQMSIEQLNEAQQQGAHAYLRATAPG
jgi:hypothetical protein